MKTLVQLAEIEDRLLAGVESVEGVFGERHQKLERIGIPNEYAAVLTGYIDLLAAPSSRIESLKRAAFLIWYAIAEPPDFTGLSSITSEQEARVIAELEKEFESSRADDELRAMLTWYVRVMGGPPFSEYPQHVTLAQFAREADEAEEAHSPWRPSLKTGRGQMGRYWLSLRDDA